MSFPPWRPEKSHLTSASLFSIGTNQSFNDSLLYFSKRSKRRRGSNLVSMGQTHPRFLLLQLPKWQTNTQIHKYINTQTRKYTNTLNVTAVPPSISFPRSSEMAAARLEMYPVCLRVPNSWGRFVFKAGHSATWAYVRPSSTVWLSRIWPLKGWWEPPRWKCHTINSFLHGPS